jgi:KipI family sensor histidine kinase inhibitor
VNAGGSAPGDADRVDVRAYGDAAVLVEPARPDQVLALRDALRAQGWAGELVPAARTLLAGFDPSSTDASAACAAVRAAAGAVDRSAAAEPGPLVELPVHYDGADLESVATEAGCSVAALAERHSGGEYTVAFCGFAPGFAYLTGLDPALWLPRLASPRTSVPAGSVAIAGEFTGVYPRSSPGGWRLLGSTPVTLWDAARTPPALLVPGTRVRFVPR